MRTTIIAVLIQLTITTAFYVVDLDKTWWDSDTYCQSTYGTHLVTIIDSTMNTEVKNVLTGSDRYWIGFYDAYSNQNWEWIGYTETTYTNWYSNEPNNDGDCGQIYGSSSSRYGYWHDTMCSNVNRFICAEPGDYPTTPPSPAPTEMATMHPTTIPTIYPSEIPTIDPTWNPSSIPTMHPTTIPTIYPSEIPTIDPTWNPSSIPT
eukprot:144691_1